MPWLRSAWIFFTFVCIVSSMLACASNPSRIITPPSSVATSAPPTNIFIPTSTRTSALPQNNQVAPSATKAPTATPHACIAWDAARAFVGTTQCIRGNVFRTYSNGNAFFIDFDNTRRAFFGTSLTTQWEIPAGTCVDLVGMILEWQGRPYIVLD